MRFENGYVLQDQGEEKLFIVLGSKEGKISVEEFKKHVQPIPGCPTLVLKSPYRIQTSNPQEPIGYTPAYTPNKTGMYCFLNCNIITAGLTYDQLFIIALETGLLNEQLPASEGIIKESSRNYNPQSNDFITTNDIPNSYDNYLTIKQMYSSGQAANINQLHVHVPGPCIVVGSGSSLNDALPFIHQWPYPVYCTASHFATLNYHNAEDIRTVILDSRTTFKQFEDGNLLEMPFSKTEKNKIITHPGVKSALLDMPFKYQFFRCKTPDKKITAPIDQAFNYITAEVNMFACSIPAQVAIAQMMGHSPIYLIGCDFSAERFTDTRWNGKAWESVPPSAVPEKNIIAAENGVKSERIQIYYKRAFLMQVLMSNAPVINCSRKSIITELPYAPIDKVISRLGKSGNPYNERLLIEHIEPYLAKNNTYMIRAESGNMKKFFIEREGGAESVITWMYQNKPEGVDIKKMTRHLLWIEGQGKSPFIEELK